MKKFVKHSLLIGFLLIILLSFGIMFSHYWIEWQTEDRLYSDIDEVPAKEVALLLGASKYIVGGQINLYYRYRMEAAAKLYHAGKIKHILVSGDNNTKYYNEPIEMKKSLMELGVPAKSITLDYAGFRTLDSVVRAKEIFSQQDIMVVSQAFHNKRALFISDFYQIQAIGFNAKDIPLAWGMKTRVREYFARFKAVLDLYILKTQPKFLGEKVKIITTTSPVD